MANFKNTSFFKINDDLFLIFLKSGIFFPLYITPMQQRSTPLRLFVSDQYGQGITWIKSERGGPLLHGSYINPEKNFRLQKFKKRSSFILKKKVFLKFAIRAYKPLSDVLTPCRVSRHLNKFVSQTLRNEFVKVGVEVGIKSGNRLKVGISDFQSRDCRKSDRRV